MSLFANIDNQIDNIYDKQSYTKFFSETAPFFNFDKRIIKDQNGDYVYDLDKLATSISGNTSCGFFQFDMSLIRETSFTPIIKSNNNKIIYIKNTVNEEDCKRLNKLFSADKITKGIIYFLKGGVIKDLDFYVPYINIYSDSREDGEGELEYDCKIKPMVHIDEFDMIKEIKSSCDDFTIYIDDDQLINMFLNSIECIGISKLIPSGEYYDVVIDTSSIQSSSKLFSRNIHKFEYTRGLNKIRKYLQQRMNFKSNVPYLNLIINPCYSNYTLFFKNGEDVVDSFCSKLKGINIAMKLNKDGQYDLINNICVLLV